MVRMMRMTMQTGILDKQTYVNGIWASSWTTLLSSPLLPLPVHDDEPFLSLLFFVVPYDFLFVRYFF